MMKRTLTLLTILLTIALPVTYAASPSQLLPLEGELEGVSSLLEKTSPPRGAPSETSPPSGGIRGGGSLLEERFSNPLSPRIADAWIAKFGNFYYMVGTPCPGDLNMQWVGVWKSRDLINWSGPYLAFEGEKRDRPMWASEIYHRGNEYFIITTCNTWQAGCTMMLQKAPTPLGPYTLYSHLKKRGLDPNIFVDTDGRSYLLDSEWIAPMNDAWNWLDDEFKGHRDNKEGPFMVKNANRYLRFYARIDDDYSMEIETFEGSNPYTNDYQEQGVVYRGTCYPGHGCIVPSPDGTELWYASHYMTQGWESRRLAISPMQFGDDGMPIPTSRCNDEQPMPSQTKWNTNVAPGKPINSSEGNPLLACDNQTDTYWTCHTPSDSSYLELDLMGEFKISRTSIRFAEPTTLQCTLMGSCDRIHWQEINTIDVDNKQKKISPDTHHPSPNTHHPTPNTRSYRYLRLTHFQSAKAVDLSEWQVFLAEQHIPQPTGQRVEIWQGDSILHLQRGDYHDFPAITLPRPGLYDIVFHVASTASRHNRFTLYADGRKIATESVAHTGTDDNYSQIIAFDTMIATDHFDELRLVADDGDFCVQSIEMIAIQ